MARSKKGGHPGKRPQKRLKVIPEPAEGSRAIFVMNEALTGPLAKGGSAKGTDYLCGSCGRVVFEALGSDQRFVNIVVQCACGAYNDTGGAPEFN
jgi:hypothetical protein